MGSLNLAMKDIMRQKHRSLLFIFVQSSITASGMIMYGLAIGIETQLGNSEAYFNNIIIQIFDGYLSFLLGFAIVAGILVAAILSSLLTIARMDDLAILLALGGTSKKIQRVPLSQIFLIILFSGILGWIGGLIGLSLFIIILQLDTINAGAILNLPFGIIYIAGQLIGTYIGAGFIITLLIRQKFREIIDGQYDVVKIDHTKIWGISTKKRVSFRLAYLLNKRSKILSLTMTCGTFMLIFLTTFGILGGNIIHNTTNSYVERGYGENVYVITPTNMVPILQELYDPSGKLLFNSPLLTSITSENAIDSSFIERLPLNCTYEARLLMAGSVRMITDIKTDPSGGILGGGNKTMDTFYWGVNESTFSLFNYYTVNITVPSFSWVKTARLGDGLHQTFLNEEEIQAIVPQWEGPVNLRYYVDSVIMDPFARGHSVYLSLDELTSLASVDSDLKNVIFIMNPDDQVFNLIEEFDELDFFSLDDYQKNYVTLSNSFWLISSVAFLPAMVCAGLSLVAFSGIVAKIIFIKDLSILRALGGNRRTLMRVILWVNFFILLTVAPLAIFTGFLSSFLFLIEEPQFPSIQAWVLLGLEFLVMALIVYRYLHYLFKEFYASL
ncbi:MAG: hypothetical protein JSV04_11150 [Candidatus Heimdallarchaeota archaeon]|nr:MAG: hypothetical protein JSV04_11150 [Candidatus Heimdallarchaeota archaeon]